MNKVLFISYDGLTDPLGQSQILPYMSGLSSRGYEIHILSCEKEQNFKLHQELISKKCKSSNITWHHVAYKNKYPVISPYSNTKRLKRKLAKLIQQYDFEVFHCRSIIPALCAYPFQSKKRKLIFDIRGFWADERVEGKIWNLNIPIYKYLYHHFKRKEKTLFEKSDAIVTLTRNAKDYIAKHFNTNNTFGVVPCTVDMNHFNIDKVKKNKREELGFKADDLVFCYSGSLGTRYLTKEVLQCMSALYQSNKNIRFLVLTKSDLTDLKALLKEYQLQEITVITSCNYQDIPAYLKACDVAIYFIFEGFSGKAVSPTKQAEFLSLGKPIVTNNGIGDTYEIIAKEKVGLVLDELNEKTFQKVAQELDSLTQIEAKQCIEVAHQYFDLQLGIDTYDGLYQKLLTKK